MHMPSNLSPRAAAAAKATVAFKAKAEARETGKRYECENPKVDWRVVSRATDEDWLADLGRRFPKASGDELREKLLQFKKRNPGRCPWLLHCNLCDTSYVKFKNKSAFPGCPFPGCRCQIPERTRKQFTKDRTGQRLGYLTPLREAVTPEDRARSRWKKEESAMWVCKCDAGDPGCEGGG